MNDSAKSDLTIDDKGVVSARRFRPNIICVSGMHRSGTSLVARAINVLGASLGPPEHLMPPHEETNRSGFWESQKIVDINDELLVRLGGRWDSPPDLPDDWFVSPDLDDLRERARTVIREDFSSDDLWAWKDPRSCLTLPFWQNLLPPLRYVICVRNPLDVALSLEKRDGLSITDGADLWVSYNKAVLRNTAGQLRLLVFYEDIMANWQREVSSLSTFVQFPDPSESMEKAAELAAFIELALQHNKSSLNDLLQSSAVCEAAKELYLGLLLYKELERDPATAVDRRQAEVAELQSQISSLQTEIAELSVQLNAKQAELTRINSTLGWRLLSAYGKLKHKVLLPALRALRPESSRNPLPGSGEKV
ncbi:MAG TPA: sulfotransferase [Blastocatellia bacterium]|nr:sulfotransferase [Blastocatellia bacterium]